MPYTQLDNSSGERIFYARHRSRKAPDKAPAVVCVHGAGGSHLNWPAEILRLPGAVVYALDLPGHGRSTGSGRQTVGEYVAMLVSLLDALNLPDAVIVGHSMGSAVALEMALAHPDRVRGLVLVGSGARLRVAPAILQVMERLGEIHAPTLVISGTADQLTPVKYASFLAQSIPGAELLLVENAGHMVMLERPQEVGEALARFVASL